MANKRFQDLPADTLLAGTDLVPIAKDIGGGSFTTSKMAANDLFNGLIIGGEGSVVAAATTDLSASNLIRQTVTGNGGPITSFGAGANLYRIIRFTGTPILTHNASSLILRSGTNRTIVAGDEGIYVSDGFGNWREIIFAPIGETGTGGLVRQNSPVFGAGGTAFSGYKESTFTPVDNSGAGITITPTLARITTMGRLNFVELSATFGTNSNGSPISIGGLLTPIPVGGNGRPGNGQSPGVGIFTVSGTPNTSAFGFLKANDSHYLNSDFTNVQFDVNFLYSS